MSGINNLSKKTKYVFWGILGVIVIGCVFVLQYSTKSNIIKEVNTTELSSQHVPDFYILDKGGISDTLSKWIEEKQGTKGVYSYVYEKDTYLLITPNDSHLSIYLQSIVVDGNSLLVDFEFEKKETPSDDIQANYMLIKVPGAYVDVREFKQAELRGEGTNDN